MIPTDSASNECRRLQHHPDEHCCVHGMDLLRGQIPIEAQLERKKRSADEGRHVEDVGQKTSPHAIHLVGQGGLRSSRHFILLKSSCCSRPGSSALGMKQKTSRSRHVWRNCRYLGMRNAFGKCESGLTR